MITNNDNCCTPMMQVLPDEDMRRWACRQVVTMLANSDYYYTRDEVDRLIASIEPGISKEEAEELIFQATSGKQDTLSAGEGIDITNNVISVIGGSITSGEVQVMIDESISGKAETSAVTEVDNALISHTSNSGIHVTSTEKQAWDAKSDFSGSYNDLSDKPTIPTSASQLVNDEGYITSDAISGKVDNSVYTAYTAATDTILGGKADANTVTAVNNALTAHTSNSGIHVTSSDKTTWSGKQDALVSGTNIKTINNTSILGSGNIDIQGGNNVTVSGSTLVFN